jgi:hypothetical protein
MQHKEDKPKMPDVKDRAEKERDADTIREKEKSDAKIPDPPECDPALGDLTPRYIAWVKKYHSKDFEARYKDRLPEDWEKKAKEDEKEEKEREKEEK